MNILGRIFGRSGANRKRRRRLRVEQLEDRRLLAGVESVFSVNSTGDLGDNNLGDAICDTGGVVGSAPECTLRAAIEEANATANAMSGPDKVFFDIPGGGPHTIAPGTALPAVIEALVLDATTQPGYSGTPSIEIDGSGAGAASSGLTIVGGGTTVRGFAINRFGSAGLVLSTGGGNTIQQNMLGTNPAGTSDLGNGSSGIVIFESPNNLIGGLSASDGNVISGNDGHGVYLTRAGSTNNDVKNNLIGVGLDGSTAIGNGGVGVRVDQDASGNSIGGSGNVISANGTAGVLINGTSTTNNTVAGNKIGTDITGSLDRGNGGSGVSIENAPGNTVGVPGDGNLISGNAYDGIFLTGTAAVGNLIQGNTVGLDMAGVAALANGQSGLSVNGAPSTMIGGTSSGAGNVFSGNTKSGIFVVGSSASGTKIEGNFVGTNGSGTSAVGNGEFGVVLRDTPNNTLGGTVPAARNVVSGNVQHGVALLYPGATGNVVAGNLIGTDAAGTAGLGNSQAGVLIWRAPANRVGGLTAAERNVVSGNGLFGIRISTAQASGNVIQGNYVGTDITGTVAVPNSDSGVQLANVQNTTIGGTTAAARNVISGNAHLGVVVIGAGATGNKIQGNFIGTDATGTASLGNAYSGVRIIGSAHGNTVGGDSSAGEGNVISANGADGVHIVDPGTNNNTVSGNVIGSDHTGTADLGNGANGVHIYAAQTNTIGGTAPGTANVISGNDRAGVRTSASASSNRVEGNLIGTQIDGTSPLGNSTEGVRLEASTNNTIGGSSAAAGNVIAFQSTGVAVVGASTGNTIRRNTMFSNTALGIDLDLDGATANDVAAGSEDSDAGANQRQNKPVIDGATLSGTDLSVNYSVPSNIAHAAYPLAIEVFLSDGGDEGRTFLGADTYATADALGTSTTTIDVTGLGVSVGSQIVATATDSDGNTSEFSTVATAQATYEAFFDFGTTVSPLSSGFMRVSNTSAYSASQGYGWTDGTIYAGDRGTPEAVARDFNFTVDGTFAVDLPNGTYQVDVLIGDMSYAHDQVAVYLEGALVSTVTTAAREVTNERFVVVVADGQLTLQLKDMGGADLYAVIEGLRILSVGTGVPNSTVWWPAREGIQNTIFTPRSPFGVYEYFTVESTYQAGSNNIRVLLPDDYDPQRQYPVIYVLPVELGNRTQFGDGITTIYSHGLHRTYDAIFVAPTFSYHPWYADNAVNSTVWQETYFKHVIIPFIEEQYPVLAAPSGRLLLGFSKSGYGAVAMMLRDQSYFGRVVAWDSPLAMSNPASGWGFVNVLGTYQNFYDNYQITNLLQTHGQTLVGQPARIFLQGWGYAFTRADHITVHNLMDSLGIPHTYDEGTPRSHVWASGWMPGAVAALMADV